MSHNVPAIILDAVLGMGIDETGRNPVNGSDSTLSRRRCSSDPHKSVHPRKYAHRYGAVRRGDKNRNPKYTGQNAHQKNPSVTEPPLE